MSLDINHYPDREMLALSVADQIGSQLRQHLDTQGKASLCVPGGSTPGPMFQALSAIGLDWQNVTVFLNDERWVPRDHQKSNTAMLHKMLLTGPASRAKTIDLYDGQPRPEDAAAAMSDLVAAQLPITVLLLGMGSDMHTASLFPGAPGLDALLASGAPAVMAAAGAPEPRITLSAAALKTAICTHLMIVGPDKLAAAEAAESLSAREAPISIFLREAKVHYAK